MVLFSCVRDAYVYTLWHLYMYMCAHALQKRHFSLHLHSLRSTVMLYVIPGRVWGVANPVGNFL